MRKIFRYALLTALGLGLLILIVLTSVFNGTGFNSYIDPQGNFHLGKTLWDWMELLIVPIALAIIAVLFNNNERVREREIELDRNREAALQKYYDNIENLIFHGLKKSNKDDDIREIVRGRTLATLRVLDGKRKGLLLQFLFETGLILNGGDQNISQPIISLQGADLQELDLGSDTPYTTNVGETYTRQIRSCVLDNSDLSGTKLNNANLAHVSLIKVDFSGANLKRANLTGSDLYEAVLDGADMSRANLQGANVSHARLNSCQLVSANLTNANFVLSSFFNVDYSRPFELGPFTSKADLTDAKLINTNLDSARILPEQLKKVKSLKKAIMPNETGYDGPYSLFSIKCIPIEPQGAMMRHLHPLPKGYCVCGQEIEDIDGDNMCSGFWIGLVHHRISYHHHKLTKYDVVGGRPYPEDFSQYSKVE